MTGPDEVPLAVEAFREAASPDGHAIPDELASAGIKAAVTTVEEARTDEADWAALRDALKASRAPAKLDAEQYRQLLAQDCTVSVEQFRAMEEYDPNAFWRLESGHTQNLLDAALEHLDVLARALEAAAPGHAEH